MKSAVISLGLLITIGGALGACAHEPTVEPSVPSVPSASETGAPPEVSPTAASEETSSEEKAAVPAREQPGCGTADTCYNQGVAAKKGGKNDEALQLFAAACQQGHLAGCFNTGMLLPKSEDKKAAALFVRVCNEARDTPEKPLRTAACYNAGNMLYATNAAKAADMLERACMGIKSLPKACKGGAVAAHGLKQFKRARMLSERGCNDRTKVACNILGVLYLKGQGAPADASKALGYFKEACAAGDHDACSNQKAVENALNQAEVPGANITMGTLTADGQKVENVRCRLAGEGLLGALTGPAVVVGALGKKKLALRACTKGKPVRVHFTMTGGKLVPKPSKGVSKSEAACVERALRRVKAPAKGECAMTLVFH